jgi:hypothetical protein
MNIFVLDYNPVTAAQMLCDKHIIKMALETAQILSTICGGPYKPTHHNHPCVKWAGDNRIHFGWLKRHGLAICAEYTRRYGKIHKCQAVIEQCKTPRDLRIAVADWVQCMPDEFKDKDAVVAYRKYYHSKAEFATWKTEPPYWWHPQQKETV